jgi:hypothetical protein
MRLCPSAVQRTGGGAPEQRRGDIDAECLGGLQVDARPGAIRLDVSVGSNSDLKPLARHVRSTLRNRHRQVTHSAPFCAKAESALPALFREADVERSQPVFNSHRRGVRGGFPRRPFDVSAIPQPTLRSLHGRAHRRPGNVPLRSESALAAAASVAHTAGRSSTPSGTSPVVTRRHSAISSLRAVVC